MTPSNNPDSEEGRQLDKELARRRLEELWNEEIRGEGGDSNAVLAEIGGLAENISNLMASETVSFPYALLTQLLGKVTNPGLDALCLQRGENDDSDSRWDPRSLAKDVVVPWVQANENVLGTSSDPYVSKPLRRPWVLPNPDGVLRGTLPLWQSLYDVLSDVQSRDDPSYTEAAFRVVLARIRRRLESQDIAYPVIARISLDQVISLVRSLLGHSRAGEHAMSLTAALCEVAGERFGLWDQVERQASTASDAATGMAGDIECRKGDELICVVEVKERPVNLADIQSFENKLGSAGATEAIIVAPKLETGEADEIEKRIRLMWGRGINLYHLPIEALARTIMILVGEQGRREFVDAVGRQLDAHALASGRMAWRDLLADILGGA